VGPLDISKNWEGRFDESGVLAQFFDDMVRLAITRSLVSPHCNVASWRAPRARWAENWALCRLASSLLRGCQGFELLFEQRGLADVVQQSVDEVEGD
jgi:hypothetical protein